MNNLPKFSPFDRYTIPGVWRDVQVGALTIVARIEPDLDTKPTDFDCYRPDEIAAWNADRWCFIGVVLSVRVGQMCIEDNAASLWGIHCNLGEGPNRNAYLSELVDELLPEALINCKARVDTMLLALSTARDTLAALEILRD